MQTQADPAPTTSKPPNDGPTLKSLEVILGQILEVLQNSTIAEERPGGQDARSKFLAEYKRVSSRYDNDMLERCNRDMDNVLLFGGLFSAVNTAFIIAMQPSPTDTTNTLLAQLIQISSNGSTSAVQPIPSLAPIGYSSAPLWTQSFAYASLAFSLLAAFGAILGRQWLVYYKTDSYGLGSLEDRCKQRQRKFQTLKTWKFQIMLQSFPLLLQISLLLFGLSLGAAMWTQHRLISILIYAISGLGFLGHICLVIASVIIPDCPFQAPVSLGFKPIVRYLYKHACSLGRLLVHQGRKHQEDFSGIMSTCQWILENSNDPNIIRMAEELMATVSKEAQEDSITSVISKESQDFTAYAIQWILDTSTDPHVIRSAVALMPTVSKPPNGMVLSWCKLVRDMFKGCFKSWDPAVHGDSALAYGNALVHFAWNHSEVRDALKTFRMGRKAWNQWRAIYLPWALEHVIFSYARMVDSPYSKENHQADIHAALRMAVATGIDEFTTPDDERLVFRGQFQLPDYQHKDIDYLIKTLMGCVAHFHSVNDPDVAGNALLLVGDLSEHLPDTGRDRDILRQCHDIVGKLRSNITHPRWHRIAFRAAYQFLDRNKKLLDDEIFLRIVLIAVFPSVDFFDRDTGNGDDGKDACGEDNDQFTKEATQLLGRTAWSKDPDHHLQRFPNLSLPELQRLVLHALRVLPKLPATVQIAHKNTACWRDTFTVDKLPEYTTCWRDALIRMMGENDRDIRSAALQAAYEAMEDLDLITSTGNDESQENTDLDKLSLALLSAADTNLTYYPRLICALVEHPEWHRRFIKDDHADKCFKLGIRVVNDNNQLYLAGAFLRIVPPGQEASYPSRITNEDRWILMKKTWEYCDEDNVFASPDDYWHAIIPDLVAGTEKYMPPEISKDDLELLSICSNQILTSLGDKETDVVSAARRMKGIVDGRSDWLGAT